MTSVSTRFFGQPRLTNPIFKVTDSVRFREDEGEMPVKFKDNILAWFRRDRAMFAYRDQTRGKQPLNAADFGFEFSEKYLSARCEAYRHQNYAGLLAFERAWKAKVRSQAA
jgi:hypothetical protein